MKIRTTIVIGVMSALATAVMATPSRAQCPTDVGAAVAAACPCAADAHGMAWKNHGRYVSCISKFRNGLRHQGCLTKEANRTITSCAARATCGKADAVLCCAVTSAGSVGT